MNRICCNRHTESCKEILSIPKEGSCCSRMPDFIGWSGSPSAMPKSLMEEAAIDRAAQAVAQAEALLIGAGAGMGVDSGLPDFRGSKGFWQAYPPYEKLGLDFVALANPAWFQKDPTLAWGFYGHRLNLYRTTRPHDGFSILLSWAGRMRHGAFVFTSNVDGHFQRASFAADQVMEVHGAINWMQCSRQCGDLF